MLDCALGCGQREVEGAVGPEAEGRGIEGGGIESGDYGRGDEELDV